MKFFLFLILSLLITGCSSVKKDEVQKGKKVITLWETYNNEEHSVFLKLVDEFERHHPDIKIKVQRIPWDRHQMKLLVSMVTHTAPDICRVDVALLPRLVKSGTVVDLTQYGGLEVAGDLMPAAVNSNIYSESFFIEGSNSDKKHIFGLPDQTTGVALFYNKKSFREAGIQSPPATWQEFVEAAKKLTVQTTSLQKRYGFAMWGFLWFNFPFFNTFGVKFIDETGKKCLLDSPEAERALQFMVDLNRKHKVEAGSWETASVNPEIGFMNGMYSMVFAGPWNIKRFKEAGIDFGVSLIPRGPAGTSTNVGGSNMVVLRETKYPAECYEFLKFFSSHRIQAKWCNALGQIPVNVKAIPLIDFSKNPEIRIFTEQMKTAIARPPVMDYDGLEEAMNPQIQLAMSGTKLVRDALKDAVKKINKEVLTFE
ncbi:MAG: extracellular solute-binding protein [Elusimicrobiota bacterium]